MRKSYDAKSLKNASFRKRQTPTTVRVGGQTYNKSDRSQVALAVEVEQLSLQGLTTLPPATVVGSPMPNLARIPSQIRRYFWLR